MRKTFVLDTNVLLHDDEALLAFEENDVCLPITVLEELDGIKKGPGELARNARHVSKFIDRLRSRGSLADGVPLGEGRGKLRIAAENVTFNFAGLKNSNDNYILGVTLRLADEQKAWSAPGREVILVTKDINLRIKADVMGVKAQDYLNQRASGVSGCIKDYSIGRDVVDRLYMEPGFAIRAEDFKENDCVIVRAHDDSSTAMTRFQRGVLRLVKPRSEIQGITPRNAEQRFLVELLTDPNLDMVIVNGVAGSGKTLLSLAAGLEWIENLKKGRRILITKVIEAVGNDIGFLPGNKLEKMMEWVRPFLDNLELLMDEEYADQYIERGRIEIDALTYMRGRSLMNRFVIIDETQNLPPKTLKTLVSRIADGSKLVILGDLQQIDNPYLDSRNCGLAYVMDKMAGLPNVGVLSMAKGERGRLARLAVERL
jgi:PhoH-like ATPase